MNKSLELLKTLNRNNLSEELIVDVWLEEFHNTTYKQAEAEITKGHTKDEDGEWPIDLNREFYKRYAVTQEQHDWWNDQMQKILPKVTKLSKTLFKKSWMWLYLNTSPSIIKDERK